MKKYFSIWTYLNKMGKICLKQKNKKYKLKRKKDDKVFFLFGVPEHTNVGDQAIVIGEERFVQRFFEGYHLELIPENQVNAALSFLRNHIKSNDIVAFHGGGNMGDIYPDQEKMRRNVATTFLNNDVLFFPQSTSFNQQSSLEKSASAYLKNKHLTMLFRDEQSYEVAVNAFSNNIFLSPDIVLMLDGEYDSEHPREGGITLLRDDVEKSGDNRIADVVNKLDGLINLTKSDTGTDKVDFVLNSTRHFIVNKKLKQIARHQFAITDRLHGMIFSYLTRTPVIVFDNNNHKVERFYNLWFNDVDGIYFVKNTDNVADIMKKIDTLGANINVQNPDTYRTMFNNIVRESKIGLFQ